MKPILNPPKTCSMNNKWLKYVTGFALILNLGALAFWAIRKPPLPPEDVLVNALKLNDAQRREFAILKAQNQAVRDSLSQVMRQYRQSIYSRPIPAANAAETDSLISAIAQTYAHIERSSYQHFSDIRTLCGAEQQAQLDALLVEITSASHKKPHQERH